VQPSVAISNYDSNNNCLIIVFSKPFKKVGSFCWLSLAICIVELLICIKFGHGECCSNLSAYVTCKYCLYPLEACWLHGILCRSVSKVNAFVVDHILVSSRLASRALCVDMEIPNNDKEKDLIVTKKYLFASILYPIQCYVHKKLFKLCTCSSCQPWWSEEDYPWDFFLCLVFLFSISKVG
jgi:hypothetical protein